jgi:hypothetical protein
MNHFFSGFASELVKLSEEERPSAIRPLATAGGTIGSLIGLLASSKGKRLSKTLKGGGIGALSGAGAGAASDTVPMGDVSLNLDKETLESLIPGQKGFEPKKWGKVWI